MAAKDKVAQPVTLHPLDPGWRGDWAWKQPRWYRSHWELAAGDATIATLDGSGMLGTTVRAAFADGAWQLRSGWLLRVSAFVAGATEPVARFQGGWFGNGTITLADGTSLLWRRENFWHHHYALQTSDGLPLLHFRTRPRFLRYECTVELEDAARRSSSLALLLALGWLLVLHSLRSSGRHGAH